MLKKCQSKLPENCVEHVTNKRKRVQLEFCALTCLHFNDGLLERHGKVEIQNPDRKSRHHPPTSTCKYVLSLFYLLSISPELIHFLQNPPPVLWSRWKIISSLNEPNRPLTGLPEIIIIIYLRLFNVPLPWKLLEDRNSVFLHLYHPPITQSQSLGHGECSIIICWLILI